MPTSTMLKPAAEVLRQESLRAEQREVLGRDRYERANHSTYRNGCRPGVVKSDKRPVQAQVTQVLGVTGYRSPLMQFWPSTAKCCGGKHMRSVPMLTWQGQAQWS